MTGKIIEEHEIDDTMYAIFVTELLNFFLKNSRSTKEFGDTIIELKADYVGMATIQKILDPFDTQQALKKISIALEKKSYGIHINTFDSDYFYMCLDDYDDIVEIYRNAKCNNATHFVFFENDDFTGIYAVRGEVSAEDIENYREAKSVEHIEHDEVWKKIEELESAHKSGLNSLVYYEILNDMHDLLTFEWDVGKLQSIYLDKIAGALSWDEITFDYDSSNKAIILDILVRFIGASTYNIECCIKLFESKIMKTNAPFKDRDLGYAKKALEMIRYPGGAKNHPDYYDTYYF